MTWRAAFQNWIDTQNEQENSHPQSLDEIAQPVEPTQTETGHPGIREDHYANPGGWEGPPGTPLPGWGASL